MAQTIPSGILMSNDTELDMVREALEFYTNSQRELEDADLGDRDLSLYLKLAEELEEHITSHLRRSKQTMRRLPLIPASMER